MCAPVAGAIKYQSSDLPLKVSPESEVSPLIFVRATPLYVTPVTVVFVSDTTPLALAPTTKILFEPEVVCDHVAELTDVKSPELDVESTASAII